MSVTVKVCGITSEADGLAAAVCHGLQNGTPGSKKSYSSWSNFIKDNEDRIDNG